MDWLAAWREVAVCVGLHPHIASRPVSSAVYDRMLELIHRPDCVAIGEVVGVDSDAAVADAHGDGAIDGKGFADGDLADLDFEEIVVAFGEDEFADLLEAVAVAVEGEEVGITEVTGALNFSLSWFWRFLWLFRWFVQYALSSIPFQMQDFFRVVL